MTGLPIGMTSKPIPKPVGRQWLKSVKTGKSFFQKNQKNSNFQIHWSVYQKPVKPVQSSFSGFHENRPIFDQFFNP
jgi:hypothetical protein